MKVAVIGLGMMGQVHLRNYNEMPDVTLIGAVDTNTDTKKQIESLYNIPVFSSLTELLELKPDAISICLPTFLHKDAGLEALRANTAVLMEKPLASNKTEGLELVALAKEKKVPLMLGHVERFNPAIIAIKNILTKPNDIISIQIERITPYPTRIQDVGVITDLSCHDIDIVRFLTESNIKESRAQYSTNKGTHEDFAFISLQTENDTLAHITTHWLSPFRSRKITVICKDFTIEADLISQRIYKHSHFSDTNKTYTTAEIPTRYHEPIKAELTAFINALKNKSPLPITGEDGLAVLEVFDTILKN